MQPSEHSKIKQLDYIKSNRYIDNNNNNKKATGTERLVHHPEVPNSWIHHKILLYRNLQAYDMKCMKSYMRKHNQRPWSLKMIPLL